MATKVQGYVELAVDSPINRANDISFLDEKSRSSSDTHDISLHHDLNYMSNKNVGTKEKNDACDEESEKFHGDPNGGTSDDKENKSEEKHITNERKKENESRKMNASDHGSIVAANKILDENEESNAKKDEQINPCVMTTRNNLAESAHETCIGDKMNEDTNIVQIPRSSLKESLSYATSDPSTSRTRNGAISLVKRSVSFDMIKSSRRRPHFRNFPEFEADEVNNDPTMFPENRRKGKSVSFDKLRIREFYTTLGDNPSCREGPPIALSWTTVKDVKYSLDKYEAVRGPRRTMPQMTMNAAYREKLFSGAGYTIEEMKCAIREATKIRISRNRSMPKNPLLETFDNTKRNIANCRMFSRRKSTSSI